MTNQVTHEWVIEKMDGDDILDCSYWPEHQRDRALAQAADYRAEGFEVDEGLCRIEGNDCEGEVDRQYAYPIEGFWPDHYDSGAVIPQRIKRLLKTA